ncbi:MAG: CPBP family glutamic-type intramembrane protease [Myxococcota bacterium]
MSELAVVPQPWWRFVSIGALIGLIGGLASGLTIPYAAAIQPDALTPLFEAGLSLWMVAALQGVQFAVVLTPLAALALWAGSKVDLRAPFVESLLPGSARPVAVFKRLGLAVGLGLVAGGCTLAAAWALSPFLPAPATDVSHTAFEGLLASVGAGLFEEVALRLIFGATFMWIAWLALGRRALPRAMGWLVFGVVAVLFGLAHLPLAMGVMGGLTVPVVAYVLLLNGFLGLVFGWLFWRWGLEYAVLAHIATDVVLHVIPVGIVELVWGG